MGTKLSFFIHHPKMMLGFSSNSAERRQKCTTTIRSCRAHPRRVLDTAALNAHVPDDVGSKSHNELTWNHVVAVFTFFGLLMTALMSLCCYSHAQFVVEQRRLAGNEFNSLPQRRRLPTIDAKKPGKINVNGAREKGVDGVYKHATDKPTWFNKESTDIFNGSNPYIGLIEKKNDWNSRVGPHWYISDNKNVIFWDITQEKWHMAGQNKLFYRFAGKNEISELPIGGWYSRAGRMLCDGCKANGKKKKSCTQPEDVCSSKIGTEKKDGGIYGPKAHIAIGAGPAPTT